VHILLFFSSRRDAKEDAYFSNTRKASDQLVMNGVYCCGAFGD